jgi:hypothetical protein
VQALFLQPSQAPSLIRLSRYNSLILGCEEKNPTDIWEASDISHFAVFQYRSIKRRLDKAGVFKRALSVTIRQKCSHTLGSGEENLDACALIVIIKLLPT